MGLLYMDIRPWSSPCDLAYPNVFDSEIGAGCSYIETKGGPFSRTVYMHVEDVTRK